MLQMAQSQAKTEIVTKARGNIQTQSEPTYCSSERTDIQTTRRPKQLQQLQCSQQLQPSSSEPQHKPGMAAKQPKWLRRNQ